MRLVIVSGLSGAGKSTAVKALEDLGWYCVDNLPLPLLPRFVELLAAQQEVVRAALVIDAREGEFLARLGETLEELGRGGHAAEILFLDAPDESLLRRFSETRRRHPVGGGDLPAALARERKLLAALRAQASEVIDTGTLTVHQLRAIVQERYGKAPAELAVTLLSFGFRFGLPAEADVVFDVRFLPNPYFVEHLSAGTGRDGPVSAYVLGHGDAVEFLAHVEALVRFLLPRCRREGKSYLTVAVGCTGGRHRSVAIAEELSRRLAGTCDAVVRHRDIER